MEVTEECRVLGLWRCVVLLKTCTDVSDILWNLGVILHVIWQHKQNASDFQCY